MKNNVKKCLLIFFLCINAPDLTAQNRVIIRGQMQTSARQVKLENLYTFNMVNSKIMVIAQAVVSRDGSFAMDFMLKEPQFCYFMNDEFFVSPGDTISLIIREDSTASKRYRIDAEGTHRMHYLFSDLLESADESMNLSYITATKEWEKGTADWQCKYPFFPTALKYINPFP